MARVSFLAEGVALVELDRPEALNALTLEGLGALAGAFAGLRRRDAAGQRVGAAVLTGRGKAFCAGIDLTAAEAVFKSDPDDPATQQRDVVREMEQCEFPIIGAINGAAVTAGFEIALTCDLLLAAEGAFFQDTHCRYGIMPSWGLSQKLPRLIGAGRARAVSFACLKVSAAEAERWGLVLRVVPDLQGRPAGEALLEEALGLARRVAGNDGAVVRGYKDVIRRGLHTDLAAGRALEREAALAYYRDAMDGPKFAEIQARFRGQFRRGGRGRAKL